MNYNLKCNNCGSINPLYEVKCSNCGSYLRERIFNIDLWSTAALLIESPIKAFHKIIKSEHKNFIVFILLLVFFKFWVDSVFISVYIFKKEMFVKEIIQGIGIVSLISLVILYFASVIFRIVLRKKTVTRIKDIFSVLSYSQLPHFFAAFILFPIELIIFGEIIFSTNPSPFIIKETVAYVILGFEILVILWGILLTILAVYSITGLKVKSIFSGIIINVVLFAGIFIFSIFSKYLNG